MSGETVAVMETENKNKNNVVLLKSDGFGYGNINGISYKKRNLDPAVLITGINFLENDPEAFVEADMKAGEGCGDGRLALLEYLERHPRAKMFGGGVMMMVALNIAAGNVADSAVLQVNNALEELIHATENSDFVFGGHNSAQCGENDCGCGAIDRFIEILGTIFEYKPQIRDTVAALLGDDYDDNIFNEVSAQYDQTYENDDYPKGYSGRIIGKKLEEAGRDIRTLEGTHKEIVVVINDIEGTTLNQRKFVEATDGLGQAFSVDLWRIRQYAEIFGGDTDEQRQKALYGMLIYTLGTSAALTDGTLPVYGRFKQQDLTQAA